MQKHTTTLLEEEEDMNKFKLWHLAVICIAVFLIFGIMATVAVVNNKDIRDGDDWNFDWGEGRVWGFNWGGIGKEYSIDKTETVDISSKTKIDISAVAADININQSTGEKLEAHLYGDYSSTRGEIELTVVNTGNTARIYVKYPKNGGVNKTNLVLDITIPADYDQALSVDGVSSDIVFECEDMSFESIKINNVSGLTNLNTPHANSLSVDTVSGNVRVHFPAGSVYVNGVSAKVNLTGISDSVRVDTVSGDVTLTIVNVEDLNIDTVSGDATLTIEKDNEFYIVYDSVSGDFSCDTPLTVIKQKGGDFEGYSGSKNAPELNINSVSGDLTIIN